MDALHQEYRDRGFVFLFIYVRESHPGARWPAHRSFEQKLDQARAYRERTGCTREILVDSLDGHAHRRYGCRPDMTWILDRNGIVLFKSFWSRPDVTSDVIEDILVAQDENKRGLYGQPFYTERIAWRRPDHSHDQVMAENGPPAIEDWKAAMERRRQQQVEDRRRGPLGF